MSIIVSSSGYSGTSTSSLTMNTGTPVLNWVSVAMVGTGRQVKHVAPAGWQHLVDVNGIQGGTRLSVWYRTLTGSGTSSWTWNFVAKHQPVNVNPTGIMATFSAGYPPYPGVDSANSQPDGDPAAVNHPLAVLTPAAPSGFLSIGLAPWAPNWTTSDPGAFQVQQVSSPDNTLAAFWNNTPAGSYAQTLTTSTNGLDAVTASVALRDASSTWTVVSPTISEGPAAANRLGYYYTLDRGYTVDNASGVYQKFRYQSTDQLNALTAYYFGGFATQVSTAVKNAILAADLGGDFTPVS